MENRRKKILAIDDNQDNLISIQALISEAFPGSEIFTANSGAKGFKLAAETDPDVILLDIVMPEEDGFSVCRRMKADKNLSDIPIVFITALKGDKEDRIKGLEVGAEAFLAKPIDEIELTAQIRAMIKIKTSNLRKRQEKKLLADAVEEKTKELQKAYNASLNLLEDIRIEVEARKKSEELYKSLFDKSINAVFLVDTKTGKYLNSNKAGEELTGRSVEELKKLTIKDITSLGAETRLNIIQDMSKSMNLGEVDYIRPDGNIRSAIISAVPVEKDIVFGIAMDITKRKEAEIKLEEKEAFNYALFRQNPIATIVVDKKGKILDINLLQEKLGSRHPEIGDVMYRDYAAKHTIDMYLEMMDCIKTGNTKEFLELKYKERYLNITISSFIKGAIITCIDITEQKKSEKIIIENNRKLELAMQSANMAWWEMDITTGNVIFDKRKTEMLGYESENFKHYKDFMALVHPEDNEITMDAMRKHLEGKSDKYEIEYRIKTKTEDYKWFYDIGSIVKRDNNGKAEKVTGLVFDISSRKHSEEALRLSETRLLNAVSIAKLGYWEYDFINDIFTFSDSFYALFHTTSEKVGAYQMSAAQFAERFVHPDDSAMVGEEVKRSMETIDPNYIGKLEHRIIYEDGSTGYLSVLFSIVKDNEGRTIKSFGANQDITERKQAEKQLNELNEQNELILNSAGEGILGIDLNCCHTFVNPSAAKMLGYSKEELIGKNSHSIWHHSYEDGTPHPKEECGMYNTIKDGKFHSSSNDVFWSKDGTSFPAEYHSRPIFEQGVLTGAVISFTDITERKKVETELLQSKEHAEESDRLKSAFLANMSHEIRTPMNAIVGFSTYLKDPEITQEEKEQYCDIIQTNSNSLLNIIEDILEISKIETSAVKLKMEETNINDFLLLLYNEYSLKNINKEVEIKYLTDNSEKDFSISTDNKRLRQVFTNLINNALKFTKRGSVEFGYRLVHSPQTTDHSSSNKKLKPETQNSEPETQNYIEFYVRDTGIGIADKHKEMIFESFRQVEDFSTRNYGGTGLGLAISKKIVEAMGGEIRIESEQGIGSTFIFIVPYKSLKKKKLIPIIDKGNMIPDLSNIKILVAEDDEYNFKLFTIILRKTKANILRAKDGQECVELFKKNKDIDIVLMDVQMPVMNGLEATKILKKLRNNVPVVAQTAFALTSDRERCMEAGCDDIITKPINTSKLFGLIEKYVKRLIMDN